MPRIWTESNYPACLRRHFKDYAPTVGETLWTPKFSYCMKTRNGYQPFARAFELRSMTFQDWNLMELSVDLTAPPPEVFFITA